MGQRAYLKVYTRSVETYYPAGLAHSVHIAYRLDGKEFHPFHKNYGILFAKTEILSDNTVLPKGLEKPFFVRHKRERPCERRHATANGRNGLCRA